MRIKGYEVEVEVYDELEPYLDQFNQSRIRGHKLQSCSVFRAEKTPSFAVNLVDGTWIDSGAPTEEMRKGNLIKLLAFLRGETYEETASYLLEKYLHILDDADGLSLNIQLIEEKKRFSAEGYTPSYSHYLTGRGISQRVQEVFKVAELDNKICLPHFDKHGEIINIKYRSTINKQFWYERDGEPIKQHLYGLHIAKKVGAKVVLLVESEIDCLYAWSCGIPAVAFSGASMSEHQKSLLINAGFEEVCIATDNDAAGVRFKLTLVEELALHVQLTELTFDTVKDINELPIEKLKEALKMRKKVKISILRQF